MKNITQVLICIALVFCNTSLKAQQKQVFLGIGAGPLHGSIQSDFKNMSLPIRGFVTYKVGRVAAELSLEENGTYVKDQFSFSHSIPSLSLLLFAKRNIETNSLSPYFRAGINHKTTSFTTEGYPGITGYELKIEKDQSIGFTGGVGVKYLLNKILLGLEGSYSKNSEGQFLAGGFATQTLNTDHFTIELNIAIPLKITSKKASLTACPNL